MRRHLRLITLFVDYCTVTLRRRFYGPGDGFPRGNRLPRWALPAKSSLMHYKSRLPGTAFIGQAGNVDIPTPNIL